jgi:NADH-quinone oxidoreductase subunit G
VLNARIRKSWTRGTVQIGVIGETCELTYEHARLGAGARTLKELTSGKHAFAEVLKTAERPAIIAGAGAFAREDGAAMVEAVGKLAKAFNVVRDGWNGFNVLHTAAARVGGLDLGFVPGEGGLNAQDMVRKGALDVLLLLGADEIDLSQTDATVIYLGTHGDRGAHRADIILPGAAYTEKSGIYVNTEGRVQIANRAVFPKGEAREDWAILRALSERLGEPLPYDTLSQLRARLFADHPTFGRVDYVAGHSTAKEFDPSRLGAKGDIADVAFASPVKDFFQTNPIARASVTMAECSALAAQRRKPLMAAE